ncbi:unnamed protein product [Miscanthus lutarioriparius]|uniref:Uncharacterized protein n=1 Tax=Miscanthus lutarioriparius TaxID=422564 RepID=A0A811SIJ9_9POAL|nr:unnamed protein product [Miscanthus lutarioriparius]
MAGRLGSGRARARGGRGAGAAAPRRGSRLTSRRARGEVQAAVREDALRGAALQPRRQDRLAGLPAIDTKLQQWDAVSAAARLLGTGNGSKALSFGGGEGSTKVHPFQQLKPTVPCIHPEAKEGHDLIIGMGSGDVYSMSLRQQLQDPGRKPVAALHYNKGDKDVSPNGSRCTSVAWVPEREGIFVVSHSDGNLYVYDKNKDGNTDCTFPAVKDQSQFMVAHAKSSKSNPVARWHICQGSINAISFSPDGTYLATVGRDGYLRVFDFSKEQLIFGGRSYYGALLCCTWSSDGKYLLTGGEDDLVQVWGMDDRKIVAWGEGHNSWVSGVAFDSYWSLPSSDGNGENVYRFGSVGQDTQLLLWDLALDEIVVPPRHPSSASPTLSSGSPSTTGTMHVLQQVFFNLLLEREMSPNSRLCCPPSTVHVDPLSGLVFTNESILTICREGLIKIWVRPDQSENNQQSNSSEFVLGPCFKG